MSDCKHADVDWTMETNEDGWGCRDCNQRLGFRPDLDATCIEAKVSSILWALNEADVVRVSNGSMGDVVVSNVAKKASKAGRLDQQTIAALILADPNFASHGAYWAKKSAEWLAAEEAGAGHEKPVDQQLREAGMPSLFDALAF